MRVFAVVFLVLVVCLFVWLVKRFSCLDCMFFNIHFTLGKLYGQKDLGETNQDLQFLQRNVQDLLSQGPMFARHPPYHTSLTIPWWGLSPMVLIFISCRFLPTEIKSLRTTDSTFEYVCNSIWVRTQNFLPTLPQRNKSKKS